MECVFCRIGRYEEPATRYVWVDPGVVGIVPLNPVCEGPVIFLPLIHVTSAAEKPLIAAMVFFEAARYIAAVYPHGDFNIITSIGRAATQTVFHLHIHVVPRQAGDGLKLPWSTEGDSVGA